MPPLLEMLGIRKLYPGVLALDNIDFTLASGEVHCLVGENGAGKSTLMKILSGALRKDTGSINIDGANVEINSPADSQQLSIGIIYQDFKLVPELSVAENIFLGNEPLRRRSPFIDFQSMHEQTRSILEQLGEEISTTALISSLSVAQRQIVEIAKALSKKVRILAMDEPSAALTELELKNLFRVIRRLKSEGTGIIYISHRLEEIFEIGDRVTVLRDGKVITTTLISETDSKSIIRWMVGRELDEYYPQRELKQGDEILRLESVGGGVIRNVSLTVHRGEIFGLAGLVGAGRSELARMIFGADRRKSGKIFLEGHEINPQSPREAIDLGIGLLTEDRNRYGLIMNMGITENISLANLREVLKGPFINRVKEHDVAQKFTDELQIKTPSLERAVEYLSGGNRQKVVLARWLNAKSKLLIFDEPTAGIDVGVKYEIYNIMRQLVKDGIGVIVISSELPELLNISDRIAVMCRGRLMGIIPREEASQEKIMALATDSEEEISHVH